jgi:hypothetical protein
MRRLLFASVVVLTLPVSVAGVAFAGPAVPHVTNVLCEKLKAFDPPPANTTGTVSRCTDRADTGGSGTFAYSKRVVSGGSVLIQWNTAESTQVTWAAATTVTPNLCPGLATEMDATGVTGTSTAPSIPPGSTVQAYVCNNFPNVHLLPGTDLAIT